MTTATTTTTMPAFACVYASKRKTEARFPNSQSECSKHIVWPFAKRGIYIQTHEIVRRHWHKDTDKQTVDVVHTHTSTYAHAQQYSRRKYTHTYLFYFISRQSSQIITNTISTSSLKVTFKNWASCRVLYTHFSDCFDIIHFTSIRQCACIVYQPSHMNTSQNATFVHFSIALHLIFFIRSLRGYYNMKGHARI